MSGHVDKNGDLIAAVEAKTPAKVYEVEPPHRWFGDIPALRSHLMRTASTLPYAMVDLAKRAASRNAMDKAKEHRAAFTRA